MIGGNYRASQEPDGTWTIHDVPIFGENLEEYVLKNGSKHRLAYDRAWLESAVTRAQARAADGYLAPLHVNHHGEGKPTPRAGFILPSAVRDITLAGKKVAAIFADLKKIPAAIYEQIKSLELPYRSAETPIRGEPEVLSLALLPDPPRFKFPMLTVGSEDRNPALCFSVGKAKVTHVTRFEDVAKNSDDDRGDEDEKPPRREGEEEPDGDESELNEAEGGDAMGAILESLKSLGAAMNSIDAKLTALTGGATAATGAVPGAAGSTGAIAGFSEEQRTEIAKMLGERDGKITGLESQIASFSAKEKEREVIGKAVKRLSKFSLPGDVTELAVAKFKAGGESGLEGFVTGVEATGVPLPGSDWTEGEGASAGKKEAVTDPDLASFADKPDVLSIAKTVAAEYDAMSPGSAFKHDRKGFIEFGVNRVLVATATARN